MRRAAKRDDNERAIIALWEALGCYVETISGKGSPDTLVHFDGNIFRCEVKGAKNGLTEAQVDSFTAAHEHGVPTYMVRTVADAAMLLETTLNPWVPEDGALAKAARNERPFRPGTDKARTVDEMCKRDNCTTSRSPGQEECAAHAAETFAHPPAPRPPLFRWPQLTCQTPGCGHLYEQHLEGMPRHGVPANTVQGCGHVDGLMVMCECQGYVGMGPASLRSTTSE